MKELPAPGQQAGSTHPTGLLSYLQKIVLLHSCTLLGCTTVELPEQAQAGTCAHHLFWGMQCTITEDIPQCEEKI